MYSSPYRHTDGNISSDIDADTNTNTNIQTHTQTQIKTDVLHDSSRADVDTQHVFEP